MLVLLGLAEMTRKGLAAGLFRKGATERRGKWTKEEGSGREDQKWVEGRKITVGDGYGPDSHRRSRCCLRDGDGESSQED